MEYTIDKKTGRYVPVVSRSKMSKLDVAKEGFKIYDGLRELRKAPIDLTCFESTMPLSDFCKRSGLPVGTDPDYIVFCAMRSGQLVCHRDGKIVMCRGSMDRDFFATAVAQSKAWETGKPYKERKGGTDTGKRSIEFR